MSFMNGQFFFLPILHCMHFS